MGQNGGIILFLIFAAGVFAALAVHRELRQALIEALNDFRNNFRGGPPTPMHPSPAGDSALLRKRKRKAGD
jgi:hypothetical protein